MWTFRLAESKDAEDFAKWVAENSDIPQADMLNGMHVNQPTVVWFVAEEDGVAIAFVPVYLAATIAHLGFNPAARAGQKMKALSILKDGLMAFYVQFGIRELVTLSKENYPVARWATHNGFDLEPRQLFRLDLKKQMTEVEQEAESAMEEPVAAVLEGK